MFKTSVCWFFFSGVALSKLTNILGFVIIHCWHLHPVFHRMTGSGNTALSWIPVGKITSKHLVFCERQIWSVRWWNDVKCPCQVLPPRKFRGISIRWVSCIFLHQFYEPPLKNDPNVRVGDGKKSAMTAPRQFVCRWCPLRWYIPISHCIFYISYNHYTP